MERHVPPSRASLMMVGIDTVKLHVKVALFSAPRLLSAYQYYTRSPSGGKQTEKKRIKATNISLYTRLS